MASVCRRKTGATICVMAYFTRVEGEERVEETLLTVPGNYPAYYAAIRDALNGDGENPVPASQAIQVMELIELGIESAKHRATLCLAKKWMVFAPSILLLRGDFFLAVRVFLCAEESHFQTINLRPAICSRITQQPARQRYIRE